MVLTQAELTSSLQKEVRILLHLATKIDRDHLDYRPTPKQRSTLELLRYLAMMGPVLIQAAKTGAFDPAQWTTMQKDLEAKSFDQVIDTIAATADQYTTLIGDMSDEDFRVEIEMFGRKATRGSFLVNTVLCGYAAYRTQLFLYLKSCGRHELNTMNLWAGMDPTPAA
ncbi:MAG: hypothetical protein ABI634_02595 [Acidobacteriota bacterium]